MSTDNHQPAYWGPVCCECKFFHMANNDPKTQRCKKYNKPVKLFDRADQCKGYRQREKRWSK